MVKCKSFNNQEITKVYSVFSVNGQRCGAIFYQIIFCDERGCRHTSEIMLPKKWEKLKKELLDTHVNGIGENLKIYENEIPRPYENLLAGLGKLHLVDEETEPQLFFDRLRHCTFQKEDGTEFGATFTGDEWRSVKRDLIAMKELLTHDEAVKKVVDAFRSLADDNVKMYIMTSYLQKTGKDMVISPMNGFNGFCENHWKGDYKEVGKIIKASTSLDLEEPWCLYDTSSHEFVSAMNIDDFIDKEEDFVNYIVNDFDLFWNDMLKIDLKEAYKLMAALE